MNHKIKYIIGLIIVLMASLFISWWMWWRPPSAAFVCEHVAELAEEKFGLLVKIADDQCLEHVKQREDENRKHHNDYIKCLVQAKNYDDLEQICEPKREKLSMN